MEKYTALSDEELAVLARTDEGALEFLLEKYKQAVKSTARQYFLVGGDEEDLIQEGTIGLFKAINSYDGKSPFKNYAFTCIKSVIISGIRKSTSNKHKPLNFYVPIYAGEDDKNPMVKGEISDPEEEYINSETAAEFLGEIKASLSEYEFRILELYLQGYSYADVAEEIGSNVKSVDNAVQRIRKKITKVRTDGGK